MADYEEQISDQEKLRIAEDFIKHAPPGEFNEVFNDVRVLFDNDGLLKSGAASSFSQYNKEQFTPVKIEGAEHQVLVTSHGELPDGTFIDPKSKQKFSYDHLRKEASNAEPIDVDQEAEPWREQLDSEYRKYIQNHYPHGIGTVYGKNVNGNITLIACCEDHQFQPQNFWNGRWRAEWTISFQGPGSTSELKGLIKVQVHYYEDGNVQLVSSKEITSEVKVTSENGTAKSIVDVIKDEEESFQKALSENYSTMSQTTFKALRRQLPVTRTRLDWNKIAGYKIGQELKTTTS
ncbi:F-actin-capping subunit alpha-2-like [Paramuricea clavata]|uniref:F-actin-capping protein subunit alpha n=1 Tax=Paramuricea clavata TaxID=317549 RepID=A0A6S7HU73_PARCT|nr:F-actin-capping subunit alpha-2-like [Paramuricea clavata]